VLVYADAVDPVLAGAAIVAGADGVFAWEADADGLGELIDRVVCGEKLFPPLVPTPLGSWRVTSPRRIDGSSPCCWKVLTRTRSPG
jgi:hypothetical protein